MSISLKSRFTLIELLVVISIVSLLISILLPALGKARATSMALRCMTNVKQLGAITMVYTQDNKQSLPLTGDYSPTGSSGYNPSNKIDNWMALIGPYLSTSSTEVWKYNRTPPSGIWRCPSSNEQPTDVSGVGIRFDKPSYGMNRYLTGFRGTHGSEARPLEPYRLHHIPDSSKTPLLGDCKTNFHFYPAASGETFHPAYISIFPHNDMNADHFLFVDGHAKRIARLESDSDDGAATAIIYRWAEEHFTVNRLMFWY